MPAWLAVVALLAFGLRGLIPVGFEPADGSFALVICHEGFPAHFFSHGMPSHAKHAGGGARHSHCAFCNGTSPAPVFSFGAIARIAPVAIGVVRFFEPLSESVRLAHIPQARAPPHLA
jgi:hypothetical protein